EAGVVTWKMQRRRRRRTRRSEGIDSTAQPPTRPGIHLDAALPTGPVSLGCVSGSHTRVRPQRVGRNEQNHVTRSRHLRAVSSPRDRAVVNYGLAISPLVHATSRNHLPSYVGSKRRDLVRTPFPRGAFNNPIIGVVSETLH